MDAVASAFYASEALVELSRVALGLGERETADELLQRANKRSSATGLNERTLLDLSKS